MIREEPTVYQTLELATPKTLHRRHFYRLDPIGIGTPYAESLGSYLLRLAEAHNISISTLVNKEIIPLMDKKEITNHANGKCTISSIEKSMRFVNTIEKLTFNKSIRFLTMLPWSKLFSINRLYRRSLAWCPLCFTEQKNNENILYEPLIWRLDVVDVCLIHKIPLISECPYCHRKNFPIKNRTKIGYCSWCGEWLGNSNIELSSNQNFCENKEQLWVISNMEQLIMNAPYFISLQPIDYVTLSILSMVRSSKMKESKFASLCGINSADLGKFLYKSSIITNVVVFMKICFYLKLNLFDLLVEKNYKDSPKDCGRSWISDSIIENCLKDAITSNQFPPMPLSEIVLRLRVNYKYLNDNFPDLCQIITKNFKDYFREIKNFNK